MGAISRPPRPENMYSVSLRPTVVEPTRGLGASVGAARVTTEPGSAPEAISNRSLRRARLWPHTLRGAKLDDFEFGGRRRPGGRRAAGGPGGGGGGGGAGG